MGQPMDLESAVMCAWRTTATDLAGLRAILDAYAAEPRSEEMAETLDKAQRKDWTLMAAMAGKASPADRSAARVGRAIEQKARAAYRPGARTSRAAGRHAGHQGGQSLIERFKAHLAA
jgi:hypothetical protein